MIELGTSGRAKDLIKYNTPKLNLFTRDKSLVDKISSSLIDKFIKYDKSIRGDRLNFIINDKDSFNDIFILIVDVKESIYDTTVKGLYCNDIDELYIDHLLFNIKNEYDYIKLISDVEICLMKSRDRQFIYKEYYMCPFYIPNEISIRFRIHNKTYHMQSINSGYNTSLNSSDKIPNFSIRINELKNYII